MPSNNPNVAGKHHRAKMGMHVNRVERMSTDLYSWLDRIEQEHHDYYSVLLRELAESTRPEDSDLYDQLDREYARQCASLQAARERITEAAAHIRNATRTVGGHASHLLNVTPEEFQ